MLLVELEQVQVQVQVQVTRKWQVDPLPGSKV